MIPDVSGKTLAKVNILWVQVARYLNLISLPLRGAKIAMTGEISTSPFCQGFFSKADLPQPEMSSAICRQIIVIKYR
jgi:hypothetical protein